MNKFKKYLISAVMAVATTTSFAASFNDLPLNDAIKTVRGDGSRKLAVFSDPLCPYSQKYEAELQRLNNVTIYTFVTPLNGTSAVEVATGVVCSSNPSGTWRNWMINKVDPGKGSCNAISLTRNLPLYKRVGARGTPFTILGDGNTIGGAAPAQEVERMLKFAYRDLQPSVSTAPSYSTPEPISSSGAYGAFK